MLKKLLIILVLMLPGLCYAAIYQYTDAQGKIVYTNQYHSDAKLVDLPNLNQLSEPKGVVKKSANVKTQEQLLVQQVVPKQNYTTFNIASPSNLQTFQNQRDIGLKFNIKPKLQKGDKIAIYIDGESKAYFVGAQSQVTLNNLPRGEHKIQARLLDANNKVLRISSEITIYVHYAALGKSAAELRTPSKKLTPPIQPLNPPAQRLTPAIKPLNPATRPINP